MPAPRTVLVVDDSEPHRRLLELVLHAHRYEVEAVADGESALAFLQRATPDAIILDVQMPGLSGLDVAARVRRLQRLRHVPILFMTSHASDEVRAAAARCGALDVLAKPIAGTDLRSRLATLFA